MATGGGDDGEKLGDEGDGGWRPRWREKAEKMIVCRKMGAEGWFSANFELVFLLPLSMKIAPIYRAGKRAIFSSMGEKYQPLIRPDRSKPLAQSGHLELPNLQTARGAHFGPINEAVSNLFDPTGPFSRIKVFQLDILVHALSNLGYKRGSRQGLKSATRAAQWRRR